MDNQNEYRNLIDDIKFHTDGQDLEYLVVDEFQDNIYNDLSNENEDTKLEEEVEVDTPGRRLSIDIDCDLDNGNDNNNSQFVNKM